MGSQSDDNNKGKPSEQKEGSPKKALSGGRGPGGCYPRARAEAVMQEVTPPAHTAEVDKGSAHSAPLWEAQLLLTEAPQVWV